jgi:general nucleoside transport system ATP-binding protein
MLISVAGGGAVATEPVLRAVELSKRFDEVVALRGVSLDVAAGEIHVLAGENGAGKTTLVSILSGLYRADGGTIHFGGRPVVLRTPADAVRLGIGMVHQHSELVLAFTALENIALGREGHPLRLRPRRWRTEIGALAQRYGLAVPPDVPVRALSVGERQKVEMLKVLSRGIRVLILDEPTTLLTPQEAAALLGTIRSLTQHGLAVIFITHKLREALDLGDRISVLRAGERVATVGRGTVTEADLVTLMFGARAGDSDDRARTVPGVAGVPHRGGDAGQSPPCRDAATALSVSRVTVRGEGGVSTIHDCTFAVRAGEIVGMAGVAGNGQRELAETLIGLRTPARGTIALFERNVTRWSIDRRLAAGMAFIPEDRLGEGILPSLSLAETLMLGLQPVRYRRSRYSPREALRLAAQAISEYAIAAPSGRVPTAALSGGNVQKVLVARALLQARAAGRTVLIAVNPTRGLDVATAARVHRELRALRDERRGVLVISEDLDELMALCDVILVLHRGRIVGDLPRTRFDVHALGRMMTGTPAAR